MGLGIVSLPVVDGLATIENLYGNARDIRVTKDDSDMFVVECNFNIYKTTEAGDILVTVMPIMKKYDNDFLTKTWNDVYTIIKEHLTDRGINYTDEN